MIRHILLIAFKRYTQAEQIEAVNAIFRPVLERSIVLDYPLQAGDVAVAEEPL